MTKIKVRSAIACFLLLNAQLYAQLNPLSSQYFQNTYLANPAMAGMQKGLRVNVAYRNQWSSMPGSPKNTVVTSDYQENRVGLGLSMLKDQAGLINRTQVLGTYAYHLPLNGTESALHFGLSFGFNSQRLNSLDVVAAANDPSIANFENNTVLDGAFGLAYTKGKFGLELAFNNLKNQFNVELHNSTDYTTFFTAASYAFTLQNSWMLNTKFAYRGVKGYTNLFDVGAELKTRDQQLGFLALYHSNKSSSFGLSYEHKNGWRLATMYTTSAANVQTYANGAVEFALQINLTKNTNETN
ncbi:MAG: PorP/SprF family type IX secretion system membrane protein [Sphingobacteriales bacterium]|nr:PorP/SprF family type IX secretion system membrane protein [Sphingobacteriales bacterium]